MLEVLMAAPALAGCEADAQAAAEAIAARNRSVEQVVAAGDIEAYGEIFTEDTFQAGPGAPPYVGRAGLVEAWTAMAAMGGWYYDLNTLEVWACGDSAVERGFGALSFEPNENAPPGMAAFTTQAHYVAHWVKEEDGAWRIRSEAVSALPPPADAP